MGFGHIPENTLDDILSRLDIVELVSGYIPLKRAGRNFKAACPFHHEKTPSFMVSPDRQIYHCFGCGESGNAFKFLMSYERMDFLEAVEVLAKKAGVSLPENQKENPASKSLSEQLYKINELAAAFYENALYSKEGSAARDYLLKRGIKEETIKLVKVGFAPNRWDALISHLRAKNISLSLLEKAGLVVPKENGGYYDMFRNRVIFPIFDIRARILGFGARVLPADALPAGQGEALAKYVNSPETAIYTKGKNLYGLNLAKEQVRQNDCVGVVEGYLDFIIPYQEGFQNIVASQGTALTIEQVRLLKRYTHNIVMIYDGDAAGELATLRSLDVFIEEGINVSVVSLPEGFDPDLFVRKSGMEVFKDKVTHAQNLFDYKLKILKSRYPAKEALGKTKISSEMLPTINKFKNAVLKSEYIKKLAQELDIKEEALFEELKKIKDDKPRFEHEPPALKKISSMHPTEKLLIKLMLEEKHFINHIKQCLEPADFQDDKASRIVSTMFDFIEQGKDVGPSLLITHFGEEDISRLICESMFAPEVSSQDKERILDDCVRRLKNKRLVSERQHLQEEIKAAEESGDEEQLNRLKHEFCELTRKR